jgi:hypothetical protein
MISSSRTAAIWTNTFPSRFDRAAGQRARSSIRVPKVASNASPVSNKTRMRDRATISSRLVVEFSHDIDIDCLGGLASPVFRVRQLLAGWGTNTHTLHY